MCACAHGDSERSQHGWRIGDPWTDAKPRQRGGTRNPPRRPTRTGDGRPWRRQGGSRRLCARCRPRRLGGGGRRGRRTPRGPGSPPAAGPRPRRPRSPPPGWHRTAPPPPRAPSALRGRPLSGRATTRRVGVAVSSRDEFLGLDSKMRKGWLTRDAPNANT